MSSQSCYFTHSINYIVFFRNLKPNLCLKHVSQITVFVQTLKIQLNAPAMVFLFLPRTVNSVELCSTMDGAIWRYAVSRKIFFSAFLHAYSVIFLASFERFR